MSAGSKKCHPDLPSQYDQQIIHEHAYMHNHGAEALMPSTPYYSAKADTQASKEALRKPASTKDTWGLYEPGGLFLQPALFHKILPGPRMVGYEHLVLGKYKVAGELGQQGSHCVDCRKVLVQGLGHLVHQFGIGVFPDYDDVRRGTDSGNSIGLVGIGVGRNIAAAVESIGLPEVGKGFEIGRAHV